MYYTLTHAWEAYEAKDYTLAKQIFSALIEIAPDEATRHNHEMGYACVLLKEGLRNEAEARLEKLYEATGDDKFLVPLNDPSFSA